MTNTATLQFTIELTDRIYRHAYCLYINNLW